MPDIAATDKSRSFEIKEIVLEKLRWLAFMLILGSFSAGTLMGVSAMIPLDGEGMDLEAKLLVLKAFAIEHSIDNIEEVYQAQITTEEIDGLTLYRSSEGGVAFEFAGRGHQGQISGLIALAPDLETLKGLVILEQQETPGLGGRIAEAEFLDQFKGLVIDPELIILPAGRTAAAAHEVEGITGATMTSKALEGMLQKSIQEVKQMVEVN